MGDSRRILAEMFISEATLEFPDGEIDAVNRVLAGAARRGAIPRDALENWPILRGPAQQQAKAQPKPVPQKPKVKEPAPASKAAQPAPDSRSSRLIPATNRFRQQDASGAVSHGEPKGSSDKPEPKSDVSAKKPGVVKRAIAAARRRDPESGLPKPKSAATKVHGGHGPATSLPRLDRMFGGGSGEEFADEKTDPEYVSPFAHIPGLEPNDNDDDEIDYDEDRATANGFSDSDVPNGFFGKGVAGKRSTKGFPEADVWDRFAGRGEEPAEPEKKKKQGRLSRLFKGRRDDDI